MTPRKRWWRAADALRRAPLSNDELAMLVRLGCTLNERWARDGLSADQACEATLSPADLCAVAGCERLAKARYTLDRLAVATSLIVRMDGRYTSIEWHNWADFQELRAPRLPGERPGNSPSASATRDTRLQKEGAGAPSKKNDTEQRQEDARQRASNARAKGTAPSPVAEIVGAALTDLEATDAARRWRASRAARARGVKNHEGRSAT